MIRFKISRGTIALVVTLMGTLCGTATGYLLGRNVAFRMAGNWLDDYAQRVVNQVNASSLESRILLLAINSSSMPFCSKEEITFLRDQVLRSEFLKDAGHIVDGKITCSASGGRQNSHERFTPSYTLLDGTTVYTNLVPVKEGEPMMLGLQAGSSYVVFGRHTPAVLGPVPMRISVNVDGVDGNGHLSGLFPKADTALLRREGRYRTEEDLLATRCSPAYSYCVTSYTSQDSALAAEPNKILGGAVSGGILGTIFGLLLSMAHRRSLSLEQQLRRAIRRDRLQVAYQPVVDLVSGEIVGAEALARWHTNDGHQIVPNVFIPLAEEHGFVGELTRLVIHRVLHDFRETLRSRPGFHININVTANDLSDPTFMPMLANALKQTQVPSQAIGIEITESGTARQEVAKAAILELRNNGHRVYIDDFGTGYSSLAYLSDLAVDVIKIDKAFTQAIGTDAVTVSILPQILAMAETLHLQVVVEGVETPQQAGYFASIDQPIYGQGWFFGYPVPPAVLHQLLEGNKPASEHAGLFTPESKVPCRKVEEIRPRSMVS